MLLADAEFGPAERLRPDSASRTLERSMEVVKQRTIRAAAFVDHCLGPVEVLGDALRIPACWRANCQVLDVRNLVGDLHRYRVGRQRPRVLDLQLLPSCPRQRLIVGDLLDDAANPTSERILELLRA